MSRTFYARGQTGQQLLLGAYQSLMRQVAAGSVTLFPRREMLDLVLVDGKARGIVVRNLLTGELESHVADAVLPGDRRLRQRLLPVDQRRELERHGGVALLQARRRCSPTRASRRSTRPASRCRGDHQSKLTLMSESLRNDGRVWVPKAGGDKRPPQQIPEADRDYYLERRYPSFGNLVPRDVASRAAKAVCDEGRGVGDTALSVYLDFADAIRRVGEDTVRARYGNLFQMYEKITDEDPYKVPMRIYPAVHYTMGGLWVDYNLMSTVPGLHVLGEANFSDHGANRLGASALMQGLADGYFVIPATIGHYLASTPLPKLTTDHDAFKEAAGSVRARIDRMLASKGKRTARELHRELGRVLWDYVGMARTDAGPAHGADQDPAAARGVLGERLDPGRAEHAEQEPRVRRPRRRLPGVRRGAGDGRARAARVVRRPLPRGIPDARQRGPARRRAVRPRRRLGVSRARSGAGAPRRAARVRARAPDAAELQVNLTLRVWRQSSPSAPGKLVDYQATASRPTCRSSRCSTSSTKA